MEERIANIGIVSLSFMQNKTLTLLVKRKGFIVFLHTDKSIDVRRGTAESRWRATKARAYAFGSCATTKRIGRVVAAVHTS